jgi:bifunctional non-homologous end joining protein LigD
MTLPETIEPMLATLGKPPAAPGYAVEFKWDGIRCLAFADRRGVRLVSRNGRDVTGTYPELAELAPPTAGREFVLDGEIVAVDGTDRPSFSRLQQRMQLSTPSAALVSTVPVRYYAFDVLHLDGVPTMAEPYERRRELLAGLGLNGAAVRVPPHFVDVDPDAVMTAARAQGLEGIVVKRLSSAYQPGRRSRDWTKVPFNQTQEVVIIGHKPGRGRRAGTVGSLLLAVAGPGGRLSFAGGVGTGFTQDMLRHLQALLAPLSRPAPPVPDIPREFARGAHWVEPVLVGEVAFRDWTPDGRLRHPAWRGLRADKAPTQSRRVAVPAEAVVGAMQTADGRWRVEVVRRGPTTWYRIVHGDDVVDWLAIAGVERVLAGAGVRMDDLVPDDAAGSSHAGGAAPGHRPARRAAG